MKKIYNDMKKVLFIMRHGVGDTIQFSIILKHVKKYRPSWEVDVVAPRGKNDLLVGLCNNVLSPDNFNESSYDEIFNFRWWEASMRTSEACLAYQVPATKVTKSLVEYLNIEPDRDLFGYETAIPSNNRLLAKRYLKKIPFQKYVGFHYQGLTSTHKKNVNEDAIKRISRELSHLGFGSVVFDWDAKEKISNGTTIFRPGKLDPVWEGKKHGSNSTLAALIEQMDLFIGIDSGPLHIAGATNTPSIALWKDHHPIHYYDFSDNVIHLLPRNSKRLINHNKQDVRNGVETFFKNEYNYLYYDDLEKSIFETITKQIEEKLLCESIIEKNSWWEIKPKSTFSKRD